MTVAASVDAQTEMMELFIGEMRLMRKAVDRLSSTSAGSSQKAASTGSNEGAVDVPGGSGQHDDDDEEMVDETHVGVDVQMRSLGLEVKGLDYESDAEDEDDDADADAEEDEEENAADAAGDAASGAALNEPSNFSLPPRPRPRYTDFKGKGKAI